MSKEYPTKKYIEYWVEEIDQHGDIINHLYQENNKSEAIRIADAAKFEGEIVTIEIERVERYGNDADGITRQEFETIYTRNKEE